MRQQNTQIQTEVENQDRYIFKVAECRSSSSPNRKVLALADGHNKIKYFENHHSFIRWVESGIDIKDVYE